MRYSEDGIDGSGEANESESPVASRVTITDDAHTLDRSQPLERLTQIVRYTQHEHDDLHTLGQNEGERNEGEMMQGRKEEKKKEVGSDGRRWERCEVGGGGGRWGVGLVAFHGMLAT